MDNTETYIQIFVLVCFGGLFLFSLNTYVDGSGSADFDDLGVDDAEKVINKLDYSTERTPDQLSQELLQEYKNSTRLDVYVGVNGSIDKFHKVLRLADVRYDVDLSDVSVRNRSFRIRLSQRGAEYLASIEGVSYIGLESREWRYVDRGDEFVVESSRVLRERVSRGREKGLDNISVIVGYSGSLDNLRDVVSGLDGRIQEFRDGFARVYMDTERVPELVRSSVVMGAWVPRSDNHYL